MVEKVTGESDIHFGLVRSPLVYQGHSRADSAYSFQTIPAICCHVRPVHVLSDLLRVLLIEKPLSEYRHLKRVKRLQNEQTKEFENWVLVELQVPRDEDHDHDHENENNDSMDSLFKTEIEVWLMDRFPILEKPLQLRLFRVPKRPAPQYEDYREMNVLWPVTFHRESTSVEPVHLEWSQFEPIYQEFIRAKANEILASAPTLPCNERTGKGMLIDPESMTVLTGSLDEDSKSVHPLKHTVMQLLDRLGHQQKTAAEKRRQGSPCALSEMSMANAKIPYLATGYDILLAYEPCLMCSMALVHSRIKRVFYLHENLRQGGLGSRAFLHDHVDLNHHFSVYKMKQSCSARLE